MPAPRWNLGVTVSNGKIYALGGQNGPSQGYQFQATAYEYDPKTDIWAILPSMPTARGYVSAVGGNNGYIYAIGGWNNISHLKTVEEYNILSRTWSAKTDLTTGRNALGLAATDDGKLYAIGG